MKLCRKARESLPDDSRHLVKGAVILTVAAFVIKILSAVYRVPFQNIVGDTGFYIYQQVYPLYGIASVLAASGFPVVISRLVAQNGAVKGQGDLQRILQSVFVVLLFLGVSLFLLVFFGAQTIAGWMGDPLLAPVVKVIAFPFLLLPFLSVWRGFFQGLGNMAPTAISQVTEQFIRVAAILVISYFLVNEGHSLYDTGRGAWTGAIIGGVIGLLVLGLYVRKTGWHLFAMQRLSFRELLSTGKIVLVHGTAICFSGLLLILFQLVDSLNLYSLLVQAGLESEEAKALKGVFDRGQPLIQLGTVAATSLSLALVPTVTAAWAQGNVEMLQKKVDTSLKVSMTIGLGAAVGLINIIKPTNIMLFKNADGTAALAVLAAAIFFASVIITLSGVLQGLGRMMAPAKYILFGTVCKYIGNLLLVPIWGLEGAAWATVIGLLGASLLILLRLKSFFSINSVLGHSLTRLAVAAVAMTVVLQGWLYIFDYLHLTGRLMSAVSALTGVVIGGFVFLIVTVRTNLFTEVEINHVPYFSKLKKLVGVGRRGQQ
ncbi:polysaccharide biosynthesis protein [Siminovitchia acidinfaciens]|uniref:Polysaccharide biosynthesis protein n=1 Tax=Siminovitchia acidinfaciens TaxID=2321395 RepID=A0A429XTL5_9BACI|nr:polysaccharide biosynthesis protein [Siminovitchia acidinfaciens]